ncbi:hypothetical protein [Deinococcus budaensis]|uniref:Uncharacterized protein n=1 Tax=Deinococcus budaensis TaxID=1665626 RepID=A0A7W8GF38_9DEIO|nr:hypothetical protein [Deinococcus budaensis]MBB5234482.1 hypothetical protein [Deinococcus budaensis]
MSLVRIHFRQAGLLAGETKPWLGDDLRDYDAPFDLESPPVGGARAADSRIVAHTGDNLPTVYAYTATGHLHATSPEALQTLYFKVKRQLRHADEIWRGDRYLKIAGATLGGREPLRGQCVVPAPIVCRVVDLRWYDKLRRPLE